MKSSEQKEIEWKEKRRGKITASTLPDLMKAGKGCPFGKAALDAMYLVRYERRTGTFQKINHLAYQRQNRDGKIVYRRRYDGKRCKVGKNRLLHKGESFGSPFFLFTLRTEM